MCSENLWLKIQHFKLDFSRGNCKIWHRKFKWLITNYLTLNVRGLNKSRKGRQLFRWLHQQQSDIIFLQETYSSFQTIKMWEAEWGAK